MSGPDNQDPTMDTLVLTSIRARDAQDVFEGAGSDLFTPEGAQLGAREVLNSSLWPSSEPMAKAAIVELQRSEAQREGANHRLANKLFEIAGHNRAPLPLIANKLVDYLSAIYGAAMRDSAGNGGSGARHGRVENRRMVKAAEELVERVQELCRGEVGGSLP